MDKKCLFCMEKDNTMKKMKNWVMAATLVCGAGLLMSCANRHVLFHSGTSSYTIVLDADAPASERYAAQELRDWLREVSGVELPIVSAADPSASNVGHRLIVGYSKLTAELVPDTKRPDDRDDAFTWQNVGGDILFWGGCKRGTLYSVYSFLEEELDCRWYSQAVSIAPKRKAWYFNSKRSGEPALFCHEQPGIRIRDNCVYDARTIPAFSARLRNNFVRLPDPDKKPSSPLQRGGPTLAGTAEGYWGVHAMGSFISPREYFDTHPEYFSLRDGKRQSGYAQLCLSNADVLRICTEKIRGVMRREPDFLIYSMEQNDNMLPCQCDSCQAIVQRYGGESGLMVWFVNQVADAVKDEFPDKFIGTFAYQYTRHAPTGIVPHENVVIRLCSIECCLLHAYNECPQNQEFLRDLEAWGSIAPHLYIWDYVTDFALYCLPVANWRTMQSHIQDFRDNHAIGILEEGDYQTTTCELRELRSYLLSKLMWNPDADVDAIIRDFTDGYYGAAGRYVRDYLTIEEKILRRSGMHTNCYAHTMHEMFTDEFIREGRRIFAEAKAAVAKDSALVARVETAEFPLCLLQMERMPQEGVRDGADILFEKVARREGYRQMTEFNPSINVDSYLEKFARIAQEIKERETK